ncbi:MAG: 4-hydroxy-3-methylbut-2-enyl diphosphate reductase [Bacteroidetes bacterium RIFCSPLOWO2_12_FULL_37_12]|nr:MAG: 4-hydroxy-3-methylbut-2-enyl diphosphate reductase [Bacteroidetes bacterium RIFCSPLOWO2_12_FULL_37_12]
MLKVTIDTNSGFCFGVVFAIQMAEDELNETGLLYCLGDIVHNSKEVERLAKKGLKIIDKDEFKQLKNCKVLIRAHGEPPETYKIAMENNIELIDASCPVVLKLQNRIKKSFDKINEKDGQIVVYGEKGHAEVNGLIGQTKGKTILISKEEDLNQIDFSRPISLYSQTTKSTEGFYKMVKLINQRISLSNDIQNTDNVDFNDTICRQVSNRDYQLRDFANMHDVIIFVSGRKSSNGRVLFQVCKSVNERSFLVEDETEINSEWFNENDSVGICGATSTPSWLMDQVAHVINKLGETLILSKKTLPLPTF